METEYVQVAVDAPSDRALDVAARALAAGQLVVIPTETVYGLAALADDAAAAARIFEAKGRPAWNPLIVHVASLADARALASPWPELAERLGRALWPGPVTLVVPRDRARVPDVVTAGGDTVAVRVPAHPVTLALLRRLGRPLAAPSANRFQSLSPTTAAHVRKGLDGRVAVVLDAGPCDHGIESTVVDCTGDHPVVLRPGALPLAKLRSLDPRVEVRGERADEGATLRSPGLVRRHYAPRARLYVVRDDALDESVRALPGPVGAVTWGDAGTAAEAARVERLPDDPAGYGRGLFAALHRLDDAGCATVVVRAVPEGDAWAPLRDRLARAAEP